MSEVTFEIWVAVGADGYKACLGSGLTQEVAGALAREIHFGEEPYTLCKVVVEVPLPEAGQPCGLIVERKCVEENCIGAV